ncbi:MAG: Ig-like domain repeat protein [Terracidiphilus sp.]
MRSQLLAFVALGLVVAGVQGQSPFATWPTWQNVGAAAPAQSVTVTATAAGAVSKVQVLTLGMPSLDFAAAASGSNCGTAVFTATGQTCTESVSFTPAYPGLRTGAIELLDGNGNVLGTAYLSGVGQGGLDVLSPGNQIQIAGMLKNAGGPVNGGPAIGSLLRQPASVALDGAGNIYIADSANNEVRMVCAGVNSATIALVTCPGAGILVDLAGTGEATGYPKGDNGPASAAILNAPSGLALDGAGNLYIADTGDNVVRKVTAATGWISTVAGNGTLGYTGDGSAATVAELNQPLGVAVDPAGNLYIADTSNQVIRKVEGGVITTVAGDGKQSGLGDGKGTYSPNPGPANSVGLSLPYAVAFDIYGAMYIPDSGNNRIAIVDPKSTGGVLTATSTLSNYIGQQAIEGDGCANGLTSAAALYSPKGVAVDAASNVYISDTSDQCIRKANLTSKQIVTLVQSGFQSISPAPENNLAAAQVYEPIGIVLDGLGNVYYADYYWMVIEEIQSNRALLNFITTPVLEGEQSLTSQPQTVENDGNATSNLISVKPDANAALDTTTTTCGPTFPLVFTQDDDCVVGAFFAPSEVLNPLLGNVYVAGNTVNDTKTPLDIVLAGDATAFSIKLTAAPPSPSAFGTNVSFQAVVTAGTGTATGNVTFTDSLNGAAPTTLGTVALNSSGDATLSTIALLVGNHTITATYGTNSTTASVPYTIYEKTDTTLTASPVSPSQLGATVVFTATVSGANGGGQTVAGTITFQDNLAPFTNNTIPVTTNGVTGTATFTAAGLPQGVNVITATYTPSNPTLVYPSTGTLNQDVQGVSTFTVTSNPNPSTYGSQVTFTVNVPNSGSSAATGKVNIVIVAAGQTTPTYPLTVTLAGNPAAGTATISTLPVGTYNATATYAGDANYSPSTATLATPQVVSQVQTTTTLAAKPNPGIAGQPVAISATVKPSSGTGMPTGTVTFTDTFNGATVTLGNPALTGTGTATIKTSTLAPGTHSIVATYMGDANDAGSTATLSLVINQATTTTVVTAAPSPATVGGTITFTATVTTTPAGGAPTGAVNFLANGTIALGTASVDATGKASVTNATLAAGSYQITAVYAGDADDAGSTSAAITEVVGLIPTDTTLSTATATTGATSQTILVSTVQNAGVTGPIPTGTVIFQNGATVVGSATLNADGVATMTPNLGAGTFTIIAYYQGDATHGPSQSLPVTVTSTGSSFTITVTPNSVTIPTTQNTNVTVSLTSISGFTDTIGLGCASLTAGVNCHFSNVSVPLAANATATATLTIDTNNPLGGGATAMNRQSGDRKVVLAGLFLPLSFFLGWILWRFRKRHASVWSVVLILVLSGAAMLATGCGGFTQNSAAPGTYTIQVVGIGANSDVTEYQAVTLTITK